jgi:hypothetical protein
MRSLVIALLLGGCSTANETAKGSTDASICSWDTPDAGHVVCRADGKASCPAPDGCNICSCDLSLANPRQCSGRKCF